MPAIAASSFSVDATRVAWLWQPETQTLIRLLTDNAIPIRFIGGTVRDAVLGKEPRDVDMAADAPKARILEVLSAHNIVFEALDDGTELTKVTIDNRAFDIVSMPKGFELDGISTLGWTEEKKWKYTASKIDLTINAMQMTPDGTVHDYFDSCADLEAGILRFTSWRTTNEIAAMLAHDPRRILRYIRLHAYYGKMPPDEVIFTAMRQSIRALAEAPPKYVQYEMQLFLSAQKPYPMLNALHTHGILRHVLGFDIIHCEPVRTLEIIEGEIGYTASSAVRLLLLVLQAEMLPDQALALLLDRWDFPEASRRSLMAMLEFLPEMNPDMSQQNIQKLQTALGPSFKQLALLAWATEADVEENAEFYRKLLN